MTDEDRDELRAIWKAADEAALRRIIREEIAVERKRVADALTEAWMRGGEPDPLWDVAEVLNDMPPPG